MDCAEAKSRMESYASDRLGADEKAALELHIASCEGCRLEVELVRAMGSAPPKTASGDGDEWTIDRIFGAGASRAPETASAGSSPAMPPAAFPPAATPAPFAPEQLAPPASAIESAAGPPSPPEAEAATGSGGADAMFEKVPTPPPPEPSVAEPAAASPGPSKAGPPAPVASGSEADSETSFAGLELESIQASSVAEPAAPATASFGARAGGGNAAAKRPAASVAGSSNELSWDFEPADSRPDGKPPEGSLFFAEEALTRQATARKSRSSTLRTFLWAVGSVVGLGLLFVSIWIAIGVQRPSQAPAVSIRRPASVPAPSNVPEPMPAASPAESPTAPSAPSPTPASPPAPAAGASGAAAPDKSPVIEAGVLPSGNASALEPAKKAAPPRGQGTAALPAEKHDVANSAAAPPAAKKAPASGARTPAVAAKPASGAAGRTDATRTRAESAPDSPKPSPATVFTPEPPFGAAPPPTKEPGEAIAPSSPSPGAKSREDGTTAVPTAPVKAPETAPPAAPSPPPAGTAGMESPSDRLHLATVNAAQNSDLAALRKLRDTWKSYVRSNIGPERARGKRELADCLWDIQTITGKDSDKKEALLAYRDYILNAPAGGADARTVARMRQLEDAMADSR